MAQGELQLKIYNLASHYFVPYQSKRCSNLWRKLLFSLITALLLLTVAVLVRVANPDAQPLAALF